MESFWKNKKVLITGHNGFKGTWLLIWLIELGAKVSGLSLPPKKSSKLFNDIEPKIKHKYENIELDINNSEELNKAIEKINPDIVFHLAAQALVLKSYQEPILTWKTNLIGSLNLLESLKNIKKSCSVVMVTTDKVYKNQEWEYGYRENDQLGGLDPYSASKSAAEIMVQSWKQSFCGEGIHQKNNLYISTARAGNVIGGGDWAENRIIPDLVKAIKAKKKLVIRNPTYKRPWQHVLDPLNGYLLLAKLNYLNKNILGEPYNFGPPLESNKSVSQLVEFIFSIWEGECFVNKEDTFHESKLLHLNIDKAYQDLNWTPTWDFKETIFKTINWYKREKNLNSLGLCLEDIASFSNKINL